MILKNVRCFSEGDDTAGDVRVGRGRILDVGRGLRPRRREPVLDAADHLALPGLINAHDHLGLDLLPRLGEPPYASFYDWAEAIYRPGASPIKEVLATALRDRLLAGAYRNLIAGVTTVVHHDPYYGRVFRWRFPLRVVRRYGWCHSLGFGDPVRAQRRAPGRPFILHAAEGVDERAAAEIDHLDRLGVLGEHTVLVHAVAVSERQRRRLSETRTSVVWCPASNLWLYGQTAPIDAMLGRIRVVLGTDSTLSGSPTLLHELRVARDSGLASPRQLLEMVTTRAADVFGLADGRGTLRPGAPGDLVLVPDTGGDAADVLLGTAPADLALVLVGGRPRLAAPGVAGALELGAPNVRVEGAGKWLIGDPIGWRRRVEGPPQSAPLDDPLGAIFRPGLKLR